MRVLFSHSYFLHLDPKQLQTHKPYPPLAPLYAAACLRNAGHEVSLADIQFARSPLEIEKAFINFKPDFFVIYDDGFNYLTKMCLTNMREAAFQMLRMARDSGIRTAVSSSDASDHAELYVEHGAEFVIIGEAEQTLLELVSTLECSPNPEFESIDGLVYFNQGHLKKNKNRTVIRNLDELPEPAWDLIDIQPYRSTWMKHQSYFSINFVSTRGCPYKCNWCAKPIYGNRYNSHSARSCAEQIARLQKHFKFDHLWFADDIFGLKPGWVKEFRQAVADLHLKFRYKIQSRADLLEEGVVADLAASGCEEVWMGAESGSQKILDAMEKGTRVEQIKSATELLSKHGIKACFFLQFGYIGETMHDIKATLNMVEELQPDDIGISVSYPLPGTRFYERVKSELVQKQNWNHSDDLALMFKSSYDPEFYRVLQRFVHYSFRARQSTNMFRKGRLGRRALLGPYYRYKQFRLGKKMLKLEPEASILKTMEN
ncbi:MAG TPA: radical SAM protein [Bacteroidia bacterium]|nr:radical SAM protein [Bacteroidia bacterium]